MTMRPSAARVETSARPERASSTWKATLTRASAKTSPAVFRLRQFRPAATSRATSAAKTMRNDAVDDCGGRPADRRRGKDGDAADGPQADERRERNAGDRQAAGPVRDRRQEEAGDDGGAIAEDHFMGMPVDRREFRRRDDRPSENRQPQRHADQRPDARGEEERAEAAAEHRRPSPGAGHGHGAPGFGMGSGRHWINPPCVPPTAPRMVTAAAASRTRWTRKRRRSMPAGSRAASASIRLCANGSTTKTTSMNNVQRSDHRVQPPVRGVGEQAPEFETPGHPQTRQPGQRNRPSHLGGETVLDQLEQNPAGQRFALRPGERQCDECDESDAADPVGDEQHVQGAGNLDVVDHALPIPFNRAPGSTAMDGGATNVLDRG